MPGDQGFTTEMLGLGSYSGNIAAGGIVAEGDGFLFAACANGIVRRDASGSGGAQGVLVAADAASGLNYRDGVLYYINVPSATAGDAAAGTSVRAIREAQSTSGGAPSEFLYRTEGSAKVSDLVLLDGTLLFLEEADGAFTLRSLSLDDPNKDAEIVSAEGSRAWLLADGSTVLVDVNGEGAWSVKSVSLDDRAWGAEVAKGEGFLSGACLAGGQLFYIEGEGEGARVLASDLHGGMTEFDDMNGAIALAGTDDRVAVLTVDGRLLWLDVVTNVRHDATAAFAAALPDAAPSQVSLGLAVQGICAREDNGAFAMMPYSGSVAYEVALG